MSKLRWSIIGCILMLLTSCSQQNPTYTYQNIFTISYPPTWEVLSNESDLPKGAILAFVSPVADTISNVTVSTMPVDQTMLLPDVLDAAKKELAAYPQLTEKNSEDVTISEQKTTMKTYTTSDNQQVIQTYLLHDHTVYELTSYLPVNAPDATVKLVKESIKSFAFVASPTDQK